MHLIRPENIDPDSSFFRDSLLDYPFDLNSSLPPSLGDDFTKVFMTTMQTFIHPARFLKKLSELF